MGGGTEVAVDERRAVGPFARLAEHPHAGVETDHVGATFCQPRGVVARAGAGVEHSSAVDLREHLADGRPLVGGAGVGARVPGGVGAGRLVVHLVCLARAVRGVG
jgi:hypothetical protein